MSQTRSNTATSHVAQAKETQIESIQRGTRFAESVSNCATDTQQNPTVPVRLRRPNWERGHASLECASANPMQLSVSFLGDVTGFKWTFADVQSYGRRTHPAPLRTD